jgi:hypothetical protein
VIEWQTRGYLLRPASTPSRELWAVDSAQAALTRVSPFDRL